MFQIKVKETIPGDRIGANTIVKIHHTVDNRIVYEYADGSKSDSYGMVPGEAVFVEDRVDNDSPVIIALRAMAAELSDMSGKIHAAKIEANSANNKYNSLVEAVIEQVKEWDDISSGSDKVSFLNDVGIDPPPTKARFTIEVDFEFGYDVDDIGNDIAHQAEYNADGVVGATLVKTEVF